jgi:non-heme chloroperoxidase
MSHGELRRFTQRNERTMNRLHRFGLNLSGGVRLSGAEQGDPAADALLLLHGYSDSWQCYGPLMRELPQSIRTIAVSLRGHGDSSKRPTAYGTADFAGDIVQLFDAFHIERATVVGHSMGSLIAQRLAVEHPGRIRHLVLIGAFATLKGNAAVETLWRNEVARFRDPVNARFVRDFQRGTLARPIPEAFFEAVITESMKVPAHVWRGALRAMLDEDRSQRLHEIAARTLIMWGDRDELASRAEQDTLTGAIPKARLLIYPGAGHAPHWENPKRCVADLLTFFAESARMLPAA